MQGGSLLLACGQVVGCLGLSAGGKLASCLGLSAGG